LTLRIGDQFLRELSMARSWKSDEVTPFEQARILDPDPSWRFVHCGISHLSEAFPAFRDAKITQMWAGLMDVTPDAVLVIAPVGSIPGFHIATGFSGHGFGIGPGAGTLTADLATGSAPCVDPAPFRMERFKRLRRAKPSPIDDDLKSRMGRVCCRRWASRDHDHLPPGCAGKRRLVSQPDRLRCSRQQLVNSK
jgi:hypothetical protein